MKKIVLTIAALWVCSSNSFAEVSSDSMESKKNYFVKSKGYSSNPESEPPGYVYQLNQTGEEFKDAHWIDLGINYRMRIEHRNNDYRRSVNRTDNVFLSRTQVYFGIKDILDPLRFAVELQDSRAHNSSFPKATRDVNKLDFFQGYAELFFKEPLFIDRPISLRAGRMAFEVLDRKLLSRDDWGNTGTSFDGFRAIIGQKENDWQLDTFALQPMVKELEEVDYANHDQWLYGSILNWRRWSDVATLQPFYFRFDQQSKLPNRRIKIHSPGLRVFGVVGKTGIDYDLMGVSQFGYSEGLKNEAYGYTTELGYTLTHKWKPRASAVYGYASGDKNPNDNKNQRFERLYGFNRPWSNSNHIEWENLKALKTRLEITPSEKFRMEGSYSYYWLASNTDLWERAALRDRNGMSGDEIGQDWDVRAHYKWNKYMKTTLGFAHFIPGKFTKTTSGSRGGSSDFVYLEITLNPFGNR